MVQKICLYSFFFFFFFDHYFFDLLGWYIFGVEGGFNLFIYFIIIIFLHPILI